MLFSRILKVSAVVTALMMVAPFSFAAAKAAAPTSGGQVVVSPAAMQKAVAQLQSQMQTITNNVSKQFAAQNTANQKALTDLQKQTQAQFAHLQMEMQQLQAQMTKEIAQVQKEVQQEALIK